MNETAEQDRVVLQDGSKIKRLREDAGISRPQFASRVGISHGALINIENGRRSASLAMLLRIARGLHKSVDDLLKEAA